MKNFSPRRGNRPPVHTRDDARKAKHAAAARFRDDREITGIGLGLTEDKSDYAVTFTVTSPSAQLRIPARIFDVPTRVLVTSDAIALVGPL